MVHPTVVISDSSEKNWVTRYCGPPAAAGPLMLTAAATATANLTNAFMIRLLSPDDRAPRDDASRKTGQARATDSITDIISRPLARAGGELCRLFRTNRPILVVT